MGTGKAEHSDACIEFIYRICYSPRMGNRELFSEKVAAGKRTYFLDLKQTEVGDRFLLITEAKRVGKEEFERHRVMISEEHISEFSAALDLLLLHAGLTHRSDSEWRRREQSSRSAAVPNRSNISSFEDIRADYPNAYVRWAEQDDTNLKQAYQTCKDIDTLSNTFQRKPGAIRARLMKLGLV